ncbi:MAG: septum formation protein Maf [Bacteriovoracaceae bacterium]|nr:septum formation protein Maf [Bacteriovoracaceae bacterium]
MQKQSLILASRSPRRQEFLSFLGIPFEILSADVEEKTDLIQPREVAIDLACLKARAVWPMLQTRSDYAQTFFPFVIGADTIVVLGDTILGKPRHREEAKKMLELLSGKTHEVITGISLSYLDLEKKYQERNFAVSTSVTFAPISSRWLDHYLATGDSMDKAGAYGIQGEALTFIEKINGSYSNVVGFPLTEIIAEMEKTFFKQD